LPVAENPSLKLGPSGRFDLVWDVDSTTVYYANTTSGQSFASLQSISVSEGAGYRQGRPDVSADRVNNAVYAVWNHARTFASPEAWIKFRKSSNGGATFPAAPIILSDTTRSARDPRVLAPGPVVDVIWIYTGIVDSVILVESGNAGSSFARRAAVALPGDGNAKSRHVSVAHALDDTLHMVVETNLSGTPQRCSFSLG